MGIAVACFPLLSNWGMRKSRYPCTRRSLKPRQATWLSLLQKLSRHSAINLSGIGSIGKSYVIYRTLTIGGGQVVSIVGPYTALSRCRFWAICSNYRPYLNVSLVIIEQALISCFRLRSSYSVQSSSSHVAPKRAVLLKNVLMGIPVCAGKASLPGDAYHKFGGSTNHEATKATQQLPIASPSHTGKQSCSVARSLHISYQST